MRYVWLALSVLLVLVIFYNSLMSGSESGRLSALLASWLEAMAPFLQLEGGVEHTIRKLAHFCEFALLCWLLCKTFSAFWISKRTSDGYIFFLCLFVAVIDEYIQLYSPGRSALLSDVMLDFSGAFCMWLSYRIWSWTDNF